MPESGLNGIAVLKDSSPCELCFSCYGRRLSTDAAWYVLMGLAQRLITQSFTDTGEKWEGEGRAGVTQQGQEKGQSGSAAKVAEQHCALLCFTASNQPAGSTGGVHLSPQNALC